MLVERLQTLSGLSSAQILALSNTASKRYKIYNIPKRDGGVREIAHPSRALKSVQRWINKVLFTHLPVHTSATAYKKGANIRANALMHVGTNFTLRMDIENFFPSFQSEDIRNFLREKNLQLDWRLTDQDIEFVTAITTRYGVLTIGAPSSPAISNAMMYEFDELVFMMAKETKAVYSRYADDLFISSKEPGILNDICRQVTLMIDTFPRVNLKVNHRKTAYLSRRYRRSITGLVITPRGEVSIGRDRKREIKALVHQSIVGTIAPEELERTRGLVAFAKDSDPAFYESICRKYGNETISMLLRRK